MKDTITENRRNTNYIITTIAIILMFIGLALFVYDYNLEQRAININATITSLDYKDGKYKATVRYKVDKETYQQSVNITNEKYTVNDEYPIKYDIENPGKLINNNHIVISICIIGLSVLLLAISIVGTIKNLKRANNIKYLTKKGIYIHANISEVIVDNKGKKNKGQLPYKLRAKYTNPTDNKEYIFDSESTYLDLNSVIKKYNNQVVIVYIDKQHTGNYFVDLNSLFPQVKLVDVGELMGDKKNKVQEKTSTEGETNNKDEDKGIVEKSESNKENSNKE